MNRLSDVITAAAAHAAGHYVTHVDSEPSGVVYVVETAAAPYLQRFEDAKAHLAQEARKRIEVAKVALREARWSEYLVCAATLGQSIVGSAEAQRAAARMQELTALLYPSGVVEDAAADQLGHVVRAWNDERRAREAATAAEARFGEVHADCEMKIAAERANLASVAAQCNAEIVALRDEVAKLAAQRDALR